MVDNQYMELCEMILERMIDVALEKSDHDNNCPGDRNETNNMEEPTVFFNNRHEIGFLFHDLFDPVNKDEATTVADTSTNEELIRIRCRNQLDAYKASPAMDMIDNKVFNDALKY